MNEQPMRNIPQPSREEVLSYPNLHVSRHPAVAHKLRELRSVHTRQSQFYYLVKEIGALLSYEATVDLELEPETIETPLEEMSAHRLAGEIGVVPVLRAGLGMAEGFRTLIPEARVWHIGLRRDEHTLQPIEYYNPLRNKRPVQVCFIVDPMLATGGSAIGTVDLLKRWGATNIRFIGLIAAPYGIQKLVEAHPDVQMYVAAVDRDLNEQGYICPGLGDAGDRQFGTW